MLNQPTKDGMSYASGEEEGRPWSPGGFGRPAPSVGHWARRMSRMGTSAVREILKVAERPEIISFAGGLPAPELFPVQALAQAYAEVFATEGAAAMQYSTTEGWRPLRQWIAERMRSKGIDTDAGRVLITTGSQQGIDLVAKVFLDPGDRVLIESPSYIAAIQAFSGFEASFIPVGGDHEGLHVEDVERALLLDSPKLIYLVPNFQNPKGTTFSFERRKRLVELSRRFHVPIVEDDPYGELRFTGESARPLAAMDKEGMVIYLSTFSKTLAPGLRIGWAVTSEEIFQALVIAKQAADLHTSTIEQRAAARLLSRFNYDAHVERIRSEYGVRCRAMLAALEAYFPANTRWTRPEGGMFIWVELPESVSGEELLSETLTRGVAFVPGASFFPCEARNNFIRLNFSNRPPNMIEEGIKRIGEALR